MKFFVFLVTFWTADGQPPEVHVIADRISGDECIQLVTQHTGAGTPSCEISAAD